MKSSQFPNKPTTATKPTPYYCSKEHQPEHWRWHKKICVPPDKKPPPSGPPAPPIPLKGSFKDDEDDVDKCIICLDNVLTRS
ncbi:hypothetical protein TrLO_g5800 [Triparma laevis f. longispina]|uniref:MYND-type domain-containing protein n=1 Tax=Triparma laevis f. longispina TaxID=1714387 RepID=A0A9W6ZPL9_9STRA|nr:hypothetical protein TrLO_g5800 [Triparma laevis f. longispina]